MLQRETSGQDQVLHHQVPHYFHSFLLVVEFVEVLHVSEDDVLLVDDPWWDLLNAAGHLPQIRLHREKLAKQRLINGGSFLPFLSSHNSHTYIHALPQVSHVRLLCLNQLCHDESGDAHGTQENQTHIYRFYSSWNYSNFRILSDTEVKAYSFLRADLRFSSFNS